MTPTELARAVVAALVEAGVREVVIAPGSRNAPLSFAAYDAAAAGLVRLHTRIDWLDSWHSFSFGGHYVPSNTHHGLLLVSNDDRVAPGAGFGTHGHRDMEIVTWVLDGALAHRDSAGNEGVISPGIAQRMSAGHGIRHSEMNASERESVHLLQMWVPPDTNGIEPGYEQRDISGDMKDNELFALASGRDPDAAITIQSLRDEAAGGNCVQRHGSGPPA